MRCWLIELGPHTLEVETEGVPDFDQQFRGRCMQTGEVLLINGWLISDVEPMEDVL